MFVGHFAVGFASKRLAPRTSLATLIAAPLFLDILFPVFVLTGIEHMRILPSVTKVMPFDLYDYAWSHSLAMSLVWSVVFGGVYFALKRDRTASLVLGVGVFSHFILDFVTHRPDMQLYPGGSAHVGLGLWNSLPATLLVEGVMFATAVGLYARTTRSRDKQGSVGLWLFVAFLVVAYAASIFGPPPPNVTAIAVSGLLANLLLVWVAWFDRHRDPV